VVLSNDSVMGSEPHLEFGSGARLAPLAYREQVRRCRRRRYAERTFCAALCQNPTVQAHEPASLPFSLCVRK
jgi:hypothetical protein